MPGDWTLSAMISDRKGLSSEAIRENDVKDPLFTDSMKFLSILHKR